ncbi:MAG: hypothetical protein IPO27_17970 [Bacteroidetes bacterium]|nr:hypothetical protein [Bacteroidota bacterium]
MFDIKNSCILGLLIILFCASCGQKPGAPANVENTVSRDIENRNMQVVKIRDAIVNSDKKAIATMCDYAALTKQNDIWFLMEREGICAESMQFGFTEEVLNKNYDNFFPPEVSATLSTIDMEAFDRSGFAQSDTTIINEFESGYTFIKSPSATEVNILVNYNYIDNSSNVTESTVSYVFRLNDKSKLMLQAITIAG